MGNIMKLYSARIFTYRKYRSEMKGIIKGHSGNLIKQYKEKLKKYISIAENIRSSEDYKKNRFFEMQLLNAYFNINSRRKGKALLKQLHNKELSFFDRCLLSEIIYMGAESCIRITQALPRIQRVMFT